VAIIDYFRNQSVSNFSLNPVERTNYYFAFVPNLVNFQESLPPNGVQMGDQIRLQQPSNASNELWMVYSRYSYDTEGNQSVVDHYTSCQLYNASYNVQLTFQDGNQAFNTTTAQLLNTVDYPLDNAPQSVDLMIQHAYSAVMWALTDLLVGSMGLFTEYSANNSTAPTQFSEITTEIEHTSLLGSSDLDVFFDASHFLYSNSTDNSGQRQIDINLAGNRTLDVLIPELAFNTTMSFFEQCTYVPLDNHERLRHESCQHLCLSLQESLSLIWASHLLRSLCKSSWRFRILDERPQPCQDVFGNSGFDER